MMSRSRKRSKIICGATAGAAESQGVGGEARHGAGGTVLVKLNTTKVWRWETNTLLLAGFRKFKRR